MRKGMWEHVASRRHVPIKIFPFGPNADEIMLYGTLAYGLKNGKSAEAEWAARANLVKDGSSVKMSYYQVYLVDSPLSFLGCPGLCVTGYCCSGSCKVNVSVGT
jgi:hypothetical protein